MEEVGFEPLSTKGGSPRMHYWNVQREKFLPASRLEKAAMCGRKVLVETSI